MREKVGRESELGMTSNGRGCGGLGLALYPPRVRSNELLAAKYPGYQAAKEAWCFQSSFDRISQQALRYKLFHKGQRIVDLITVNGVRVVAEDGTWGLVRASSNKPELVVVVESPVSSERRRQMFEGVDAVLRRNPEVGPYNQTF